MVAIPVQLASRLDVPVPTTQGIFEHGDKVYIQTPVTVIQPKDDEISEYAFSGSVIKSKAPNENILWLAGRYVEADRPNANGAQWSAQELSVKSLTPMLMPVTVMHDPRTAVGTIADVKHFTPERDNVARPRIDTVLAVWAHRFPEAVHEAKANAEAGTLMQSMECFSPWYECSMCGQVYHKLPGGAERAQWCEHLQASNPHGGSGDHKLHGPRRGEGAARVLGDVCFTGTGLIFGSRGAKGAYSEANLEHFQTEVARYHETAHSATASPTHQRSTSRMGLVQIEDSELAVLRKERDDARTEAAAAKAEAETAKAEKASAVTAAETAEAAKTAAETAKTEAEAKVTQLTETANQVTLKDTRWRALGTGFTAKLGDFTKGRLEEQAKTLSDEDWDNRLKELEETAGVKRDVVAEGDEKTNNGGGGDEKTFTLEEIANAGSTLNGGGGAATLIDRTEQSSVIGTLGGLFSKK